MKDRILMICAWVSSTLLMGFVALWAYAGISKPYLNLPSNWISLGNGLNVTVVSSWGGRIVLFENAPYAGSMLGEIDKSKLNVTGWDGYGIYFRSFKAVVEKDNSWTFMIRFWYPIVFLSLWPVIFLTKKWRKDRTISSNCKTSGSHF